MPTFRVIDGPFVDGENIGDIGCWGVKVQLLNGT